MEKKKLIFVASDTALKIVNEKALNDFFNGIIDIEAYTLDELSQASALKGDLMLTLTPMIPRETDKLTRFISPGMEILRGTRTILLSSYEKLLALPANERVLVLNINKRAAFNLSYFLLQMGINHVDFIPIYSGLTDIPESDYVVIPDDIEFGDIDVRLDNKNILNLAGRRISAETYWAIMLILQIRDDMLEQKLKEYEKQIVSFGVDMLPVSKIYSSERILHSVLDATNNGVIITDHQNKIIYMNDPAVRLCGLQESGDNFGELIRKVFPHEIQAKLSEAETIEDEPVNIKRTDRVVLLSKNRIYFQNHPYGYNITLKDVTELEKLEIQMRGYLAKKGYVARYRFEDIIGTSTAIRSCVEKAKKMALIDRPVLITGESGTGKELFAQAIHNYSARKKNPFIALNCAALSPELLSSELFGYEEGAFTGAKKGGKKGVFELAHRGTLFLDEIGEISPEIQVKLLRVLQEKEIRKVGGDTIIPVDVRIITATNRDLNQMMKDEKFRVDLYYRLNLFTLAIPPLRERAEDILPLAEQFLSDIGYGQKCLDESLLEYLESMDFAGNIRELRNMVEYMAYMGSDVLTIQDLPMDTKNFQPAVRTQTEQKDAPDSDKVRTVNPPVVDFSGWDAEECKVRIFLLAALNERVIGRDGLYELCLQNHLEVTPYLVRKNLDRMQEKGLIMRGRGRSGSYITELGRQTLREWIDTGKAIL